ncbi:cbb3-type cytochrome oxidase assembly protein CcoS [Psychrobacter sp.]|uniref:cbb3-type cytochrome oxidase assembly protein CcoS n=1 Tax=Psychrobacter sp. TaxID=56811 RepID=UPI0025FF2AAE|nr:cbb3-type cytochrome oxidase assembly protein CcoS [Psychrobacter sp.]
MVSMYLLIPLSLMLFVVGIWAVRYAVKSNQFEDLDNESQRVILDDRQERRQILGSNSISPKATNPKDNAASANSNTLMNSDHSLPASHNNDANGDQ